MKNWLLMSLALSAIVFTGCKDDNISTDADPSNYEARLAGTWDLDKVYFDTEIPSFDGTSDPTPVSGEGTNVKGNISLTRNPNKFDYTFSFDANIGIPIPVNQTGSGTWTTTRDDTKLIVTDESGEEIVFEVITNSEKKQVYTTTITQTFQNVFSLEVDLELEFSRP